MTRIKEYPKVSVIITTYNRPQMLERALRSVAAQLYDDFEVIVVDDCSPDREAHQRALESVDHLFERRDIDRFSWRLPENHGNQCRPKNMGIAMSRGDYIAYLDDDNTWRAHHLSTLVKAIESDFSHDMVYARRCVHVDEPTLKKLGDPSLQRVQDIAGVQWDSNAASLLAMGLQHNFVDTSEMMHSRGAYIRMMKWQEQNLPDVESRGWDEKARRFGDAIFISTWIACGNNAKLVDEVTVDYNLHAGSMQVTRPSVETPVCGSYANYRVGREQRDPSLRLPCSPEAGSVGSNSR